MCGAGVLAEPQVVFERPVSPPTLAAAGQPSQLPEQNTRLSQGKLFTALFFSKKRNVFLLRGQEFFNNKKESVSIAEGGLSGGSSRGSDVKMFVNQLPAHKASAVDICLVNSQEVVHFVYLSTEEKIKLKVELGSLHGVATKWWILKRLRHKTSITVRCFP